jgi:hypothetical protein
MLKEIDYMNYQKKQKMQQFEYQVKTKLNTMPNELQMVDNYSDEVPEYYHCRSNSRNIP